MADVQRSPAAGDPAARRPVLRVTELALSFGGVRALDGVSFDVLEQELFAIIGPNGAGKTTLFNCVNGVYRPDSGSITLDGRELTALRPARIAALGVARTFQNLALFGSMTVEEHLLLGRHHLMRSGLLSAAFRIRHTRAEEAEHRERVEELLELLRLGEVRQRPVSELPFGVCKRVELGRALAMEPRLLLLDEPAAGLNPAETEQLADELRAVRAQRPTAMALIEHDMGLVMALAERILVLDFGQPIALGTPEQVRSDERVIAAYLGVGGGEA